MRTPRRSLLALVGSAAAACLAAASASAQLDVDAIDAVPNPYRLVERFFQLPPGVALGAAAGIHVDPDGASVWTFDRCGGTDCYGSRASPIKRFDAAGRLQQSFGAGLFLRPHGLYVHSDGTVWVTDGGGPDGMDPRRNGKGHQVFQFAPDGTLLMTLGRPGVAGDGPDTFNRPSDVVVAPNGDIFVADGHGGSSNARIVKFSKDGTFLEAWGRRGSAPGEFSIPHSLAIDARGRLFVGDTDNYRIQIFDQDGRFLEEWRQYGRPSGLYIDENDRLFVADSADEETHPGLRPGIKIGSAKDGHLEAFILDTDEDPSIEGVTADAQGNVFASSIRGVRLRKFARR